MCYMKSLFFFFCTFFSIIIVLELFIQNSGVGNLSISENDRQNGQVLKKSTNIINFNEGFYIGKTNKYGYYGPDYDTIKSEGSLRIALIGDSYVEGHQVFDRNHFRFLLEKNLNDSLNRKVEVLNFGMSGFNLNDNYCYYNNFVKSFNPDLTFLFLSDEDFTSKSNKNRRPIANYENNELKIDYSFRKSKEFLYREKTSWFRGKSITLGYVFIMLQYLKSDKWKEIIFDKFYVKNKVTNTSKKVTNKYISKLNLEIIKELIADERVYFVEKKNLDTVYAEIIGTKNLIRLPGSEDSIYHYWPITKRIGHWNIDGHELVSSYLTKSIILKSN
jgi:hypothetical protein